MDYPLVPSVNPRGGVSRPWTRGPFPPPFPCVLCQRELIPLFSSSVPLFFGRCCILSRYIYLSPFPPPYSSLLVLFLSLSLRPPVGCQLSSSPTVHATLLRRLSNFGVLCSRHGASITAHLRPLTAFTTCSSSRSVFSQRWRCAVISHHPPSHYLVCCFVYYPRHQPEQTYLFTNHRQQNLFIHLPNSLPRRPSQTVLLRPRKGWGLVFGLSCGRWLRELHFLNVARSVAAGG